MAARAAALHRRCAGARGRRRRASPLLLTLQALLLPCVGANVAVVPPGDPHGNDAHGQFVHVACSLGPIAVASATYGGNVPDSLCITSNPPGHAKQRDATAHVAKKCDGKSSCEYAVCWQYPDDGGNPTHTACHTGQDAVALGDPCTGQFKNFAVPG
jgi:hypothetical protein